MNSGWKDVLPKLLLKISGNGVQKEIRGVCSTWKAVLEAPVRKISVRGSALPFNLAARYLLLEELDLRCCPEVTPAALRSLSDMAFLNIIIFTLKKENFEPEFIDALGSLSLPRLDMGIWEGTRECSSLGEGFDTDLLDGLPLIRLNLSLLGGGREDPFLFNRLQGMPLTQLDLGDNNFFSDQGLKALRGMPLAFLELGWENSFTEKGMQVLRELPLVHLGLGGHAILDEELKVCQDIPTLRSFDLGQSEGFTNKGLVEALRGVPLTALDMSQTESVALGDGALDGLLGMPLTELKLFPNVSDAGLERLRGMALTRLDLFSGTEITDRGLECDMPLKHLVLSCTSVTDEGVALLRNMPLNYLNLSGTLVTDEGVGLLRNVPLNYLNLSGTRITDEGVALLRNVPLNVLDLSRTNITDASLSWLRAMPLEALAMNGTAITGLLALEGTLISDLDVRDCGLLHPLALASFWRARAFEECRLQGLDWEKMTEIWNEQEK